MSNRMLFPIFSLVLAVGLLLSTASVVEAQDADFEGRTIDDKVYITSIPITTIVLPEATNATTYTLARQTNGNQLPYNGLEFDGNAGIRRLSGTPTAAFARELFVYTAVAPGNDATLTFTIQVNANRTPSFATGADIADQVFKVGKEINITNLPVATDPDAGDRLVYDLQGNVPPGVVFDGFQRRIIGAATTPSGPEVLTYRAEDLADNAAEITFNVTVEADAAPTFGTGAARASISDMSLKVDEPITDLILPAATDANTNDVLVYSLTPQLPDGLEYIPSARLLRGTPTAVKGLTQYIYTVTDPDGNADELSFTITVRADPMFAASASIRDYTWVVGTEVDAGPFPTATDADGDIVGYSLSPDPPNGIVWVPSLRKLVGNPTTVQARTDYTYTVRDEFDGRDELLFHITVVNELPPNIPPVFPTGATIANINAREGVAITPVTLPAATDADGDTITYTLTPTLPTGLTLTGRVISGTPTAVMAARTYTYEASDGIAVAQLTFEITVASGTANNPPVFPAGATIANIDATEGVAITPVTLPAATDADGDTITYTLTPTLPTGLTLTGRVISGTPTAVMAARTYTYEASDGIAVAQLTFEITVASGTANNPPVFPAGATIANIDATEGVAITPVTLPEAADADGDTLTYSVDPTPPAGLTFNAATRLLSGTPTAAMAARTYTYTASDGIDSAHLTFEITVTADSAPTFGGQTIAPIVATVGTAIAPVFLPAATDADGDPITYSVDPTLPAGLTFNTATRLLSGTPTAAMAETSYTYTASAAGKSVALTFTIEVIGEGVPPKPPPVDEPLDVNGDGRVTVIDLAIVALFYGTQVPAGFSFSADVNADGVVNILDLTAVAGGIDAASNKGSGFSFEDVEEVLSAVAEQAADIEAAAAAPMQFNTRQTVLSGGIAYHNVADALADVRALQVSDVNLSKRLTVLKEFLHLLTEMGTIPETTTLLPNYPNPFNPETWIPYHLAKDAEVIVRIYNVSGDVVRELILGHQAAGVYESRGRAAYWDGRNQIGEKVASGLYFYTLTAGDFNATRKMLILK